jgi:hypothetical protein
MSRERQREYMWKKRKDDGIDHGQGRIWRVIQRGELDHGQRK